MKQPTQPLETPTAQWPDMDRRRSPRQAYVATAWISGESGNPGSDHQVVVFDLSLHGVGFTSDEPFEPETIHWMILGSGGLRASSRLRMVTCREREAGGYDCGAEFF
ncbi:MAG: hypothetical protein ABR964_02615 [Tepidisphaeraceae bacterium]